jgi:hypothetical protein
MKPLDSSGHVAEVLRLGLVEGLAVRAIAKRLHMSRKTVRKILGRHRAPPKPAGDPRGSILDPYEPAIRAVLDDTPEMLGSPSCATACGFCVPADIARRF